MFISKNEIFKKTSCSPVTVKCFLNALSASSLSSSVGEGERSSVTFSFHKFWLKNLWNIYFWFIWKKKMPNLYTKFCSPKKFQPRFFFFSGMISEWINWLVSHILLLVRHLRSLINGNKVLQNILWPSIRIF